MGTKEHDNQRIAVIGLGVMGLPLARNLRGQNLDVLGIDIDAGARSRFVEAGGAAAAPSREALSGRDVVLTMLPEGRHVLSAYEDIILPGASDDTLLIDCSTIDVTTARTLAETAAQRRGFAMVDAPVSGGSAAAAVGALSLMVGATDQAFARAQPVLQRIGKKISHFGPPGSGQAAKACHNMICGITAMAVLEGFALADALDLDLKKFYELCSGAAAQSWTLENRCPIPGIVPDAPSSNGFAPGFATRLMAKDLGLAQAAASASNQETPFGAKAAQAFADFAESGHGDKDFSALYTSLRQLPEHQS